MIKVEFRFYDDLNNVEYAKEPHQFETWDEVVEFGVERCNEIMDIYGLMSLYWGYEEISNNPPESKN